MNAFLAQGRDLLAVGISEDLQDFVSSLTYASFHDFDEAAAPDPAQPLEPWQVKHATAILKRCPELENLRYVLCPKCATSCSAFACDQPLSNL